MAISAWWSGWSKTDALPAVYPTSALVSSMRVPSVPSCKNATEMVIFPQIKTLPREQSPSNQVLVSTTVRDLVAGSGFQFGERSKCTIEGNSASWAVSPARWPFLRLPAQRTMVDVRIVAYVCGTRPSLHEQPIPDMVVRLARTTDIVEPLDLNRLQAPRRVPKHPSSIQLHGR